MNGQKKAFTLIELLVVIAVIVVVANTIRLAIYARRDEVSIMKLVGASNWFIRVPFLLEGLIEGLVGAALAVFAVWMGTTNLARAGEGFALIRLDVGQAWFFRNYTGCLGKVRSH